MAQLIKCPVCGKDVSNNAKQCPSCGYKAPVYHRLWFWLLIILIMGMLIYYMLPINHIISISFNKEQPVAEEEITDTLVEAKEAIVEEPATEETSEPSGEEYSPIVVDELLLQFQEDPTSVQCYVDTDLLIQGYISTLDENEEYYFIISGMEDNEYYSNFYIYISEEQRDLLQYYYTYGDVVTAYVHCNEVNSDIGFLCDLNWFVS